MKFLKLGISLLLLLVASSSFGAVVLYTETADKVRLEQYTGGSLALWRMPTPGVSFFPSSSCVALIVPGPTEMANRFFALYMFVKQNGRTYFIQYDTATCQIISFGMDS